MDDSGTSGHQRRFEVSHQMGESTSIFWRGLYPAALFLLMMSSGQIAAQTRSFDVEAGNANTTLREFARQALVDVVMDRRDVQGVQTNEVSGLLEPRNALERMLEGTSMVFKEDLESGAFAVTRSEIPTPDQTTQNTEPQILDEIEMNAKQNNWLKTLAAVLTLGILGGQGGLSAQDEDDDESIYELSPFEIDASKDTGLLCREFFGWQPTQCQSSRYARLRPGLHQRVPRGHRRDEFGGYSQLFSKCRTRRGR